MILPDEELSSHCRIVVNKMMQGDVIPFFGAGMNLSNRPAGTPFIPGGKYLPNAEELSESIAKAFEYKWEDPKNLPRVSWHAAIDGSRSLYQYLHRIFNYDYQTTEAHKFFARLPKKLSKKGCPNPHQLIVTTNYDDVLERALKDEGEPYDLLTYIALSEDELEEGKFRYTPHGGGDSVIIDDPAKFELPIEDNVLERTMILKIHGAVDRAAGWVRSSFVVTEDDYMDYLARMNKAHQIPALLMRKMKYSNFLFLGYSLGDWNLRILLNGIWSNQTFTDASWAVMHETKEWDTAYWEKHRVRLRELPLSDYVAALDEQLDALPD